jgi:hypothetical protein
LILSKILDTLRCDKSGQRVIGEMASTWCEHAEGLDELFLDSEIWRRSVRSLAIAANQPRICCSTLTIVVPISSGAAASNRPWSRAWRSLSVYLRTVK